MLSKPEPTAAFTLPNYTQPFGNAGRNIAHMPFFSELDFGLHKNFNFGSESRYLQFRAEAFNVIGNVNLGTPRTNYNVFRTLTSGNITGTQNDSRIFQFAGKLLF